MKKVIILTSNENIYSVNYEQLDIEYLCKLIGAKGLKFLDQRECGIDSYTSDEPIIYGILFNKEQSDLKYINALTSGGLGRCIYGDVIIIKDCRKNPDDDLYTNLSGFEDSDDPNEITECFLVERCFKNIKNKHKQFIKELHEEHDKKDDSDNKPFGTIDY